MKNLEQLAYVINTHVDGYYKEDELVASSEPGFMGSHIAKRDNHANYIAGAKSAVAMLGYKALFSDDRFPYAHIKTFAKIED